MNPMFPLGQIAITPGALEVLERLNISPHSIIQRHVLGDWGDMLDADRKANQLALEMGGRILPSYTLPGATRVWVSTEPDRTATTILLPDEQ